MSVGGLQPSTDFIDWTGSQWGLSSQGCSSPNDLDCLFYVDSQNSRHLTRGWEFWNIGQVWLRSNLPNTEYVQIRGPPRVRGRRSRSWQEVHWLPLTINRIVLLSGVGETWVRSAFLERSPGWVGARAVSRIVCELLQRREGAVSKDLLITWCDASR